MLSSWPRSVGFPRCLPFISELIKSWALSIRHHVKYIVVS